MILATPASSVPTSFETFLGQASRSKCNDSRDFAHYFGINEVALLRYANGAIRDAGERLHVEHVVSRNKWSCDYVVRLVKKKRKQQVAA